MPPLDHVITASEVDAAEQKLAAVLGRGGYDPARLTLTSLAHQVVAEEAKAKVEAIAIPIQQAPWFPRGDGGVEVRFAFADDKDRIAAKMALA